MTNKVDVIAPLVPALQFWRILGVLPFSKVEGHGTRVRMKSTTCSRSLSLLVLVIAISCHIGREIWSIMDGERVLDLDFHALTEVLGLVLVLKAVLFSFYNCVFVQDTFRLLSQVDSVLGYTPGKHHRGMVHVLMGSIIWTSRAAATTWLFDSPLRDVLLFPLWYIILATEQLTVVLCSELTLRYQTINTSLNSMQPLRKPSSIIPHGNNFEELRVDKILDTKFAWLEPHNIDDLPLTISPSRIESLREAHSCLADAYKELNNRFGIFMLLDLALLFIVLLSTSINFLQHCIIRSTDSGGSPSACLGHALLALDALFRMTVITVSLGGVGEEAERTTEAAARLLRRAIDWDALRELQIFGAQARARHVAFWACGLFTVDRPLLFSICGAIISYLFILSQLK